MTISNYTELQSAVASWLNRSDLTSQIVDFITIAESEINSISRLLAQETTANVTMVTNQQYNDLPTGFLDVLDFYYTDAADDLDESLEQLSLPELQRVRSSSASMPLYYAISDKILYEAPPDSGYVPVMRYIKKWDIASDSTNWLLTNHPSAYLYGALVHAEPFLMNETRMPMWKSMYQEKMDLINELSSRARGNAKLRMDDGLVSARSGRIYSDF